MYKFFHLTLITLLLSIKSYCTEQNCLEIADSHTYQLLEHFLRKGVDQETYGYILEGAKPVSCRLYRALSLFPSSKSYQFAEQQFAESLLIEEVLPFLEKINQSSSQFTLKSTEIKLNGHTFYEISFINKPKLQKTIAENINLFRLTLSPSYEIHEIFDQILHSNHFLMEILGHHDALLGIVLGYLPHNSLLGGRDYSLHGQSISQEHPPYERQSRLLKSKTASANAFLPELYGLYYLAYAGGDCKGFQTQYPRMKPSYPFQSVQDEIDYLQTKEEKLPACLREKSPFVFGPYRTEETSNQSFLELLQRVQSQTREHSQKKHFVEATLKKILGHSPKITCKNPNTLPKVESLIRIDQQKWIAILTEAMNCFERRQDKLAFIEGFRSPCESFRLPPKIMTASPKMLKGFELAKQNLKKSNAYFEKIPKNFVPIFPKQLYYQVLRKGQGNPVKGCNSIRAHYTLEDLDGNVLSANYNAWFKLSEVFQGFREGVQGMVEGEKRKVLIHPTLGYGPFTTLPPCTTLVLNIELLDVAEGDDSFIQSIEPIDCSLIQNNSLYEDIKSSIDQLPYYRGAFYAEMFEKFGSKGKEKVLSKLEQTIGAVP